MGSLDEKISVVKAKPWLVSLVCAVFIAYPNLAWIFCDMSYLAPNDHQGFLLFFGFRFLYFWGLIWFLLKSNLKHEDCTPSSSGCSGMPCTFLEALLSIN